MRNLTTRLVLISALTASIAGCGTFFEKDNSPEPSPLPQYTPEARPHLIWSVSTSSVTGSSQLRTSMASDQAAIYTAGYNGVITSINKSNGHANWQIKSPYTITSGPGVGNDLIVIGSRHGIIEAFDKNTGSLRWKSSVPGEVLAQPAIKNNTVAIKTVNGYIYGLSASTGSVRWSRLFTEPSLILRGASAPVIEDNHLIAGLATGRLVNLDVSNGQTHWEQTIANPEGAFAIQRMVDIDANPVVNDHQIYAATYQGSIAALNWGTGAVRWSRDLSSYTGMSVNQNTVYVTDADSKIWAFNANTGNTDWQLDSLKYRQISAPAQMRQYIVVGDAQGFLHWVNQKSGKYSGRAYIDRSGIFASPIVENGVLYALSNKGRLSAYTLG